MGETSHHRMALNSLIMAWILMCLLRISPVSTTYDQKNKENKDNYCHEIKNCLTTNTAILTLGETITFVKRAVTQKETSVGTKSCKLNDKILQRHCTITLTQNISLDNHCKKSGRSYGKLKLTSSLLYLSKWHVKKDLSLCVLLGNHCKTNLIPKDITGETEMNNVPQPLPNTIDNCRLTCLNTRIKCSEATYNTEFCSSKDLTKNKYFINITESNNSCYNCHNPVTKPEETISLDTQLVGDIDPSRAADIMKHMSSLIPKMNGSSVEVYIGEVMGTIVTQEADVDFEAISFGYTSPNSSSSIMESKDRLLDFSTSVSLSKEAFDQAYNANNGTQVPFVAVFRFINMAKDELNSSILHNETIAVEMGVAVSNLTDKILISFRHVKEKGIPSCRSWNGEGSLPNWTDEGCLTDYVGDNIDCKCTHLTFFAVLMSQPTISITDLNFLTYITYVGCGLSVFFLGISFFMHFTRGGSKANSTTKVLMQLFLAMLLLNLAFLTNKGVADLKSHVGCVMIAVIMHYALLATFTWFAVEAFHLCLQLYKAGKVTISHYVLKVSIAGWVLPSIVVTTIFSLGKYGEQVIITEDNAQVTMCWITDNNVHYFVNVGYYALVFIFTFTTFVVVLCWLCYMQSSSVRDGQADRSRKDVWTVLGLCCMLGITWGFAFLAHGVLQVPAYYIFTILNSFQGFFLFLYYYNNRRISGDGNDKERHSSLKATIQTIVAYENPYTDF